MGYSSQKNHEYLANYGGLVRELRSTWIVPKMEQRACLKRGLSDAKVENWNSSLSLLSWKVDGSA